MNKVTSKDGSQITYEQSGKGPVVILITGALGTMSSFSQLAELLAPHFTAINYDRRGRGNSSDTTPYAVGREVEDIEALIDHAGGSANLYGISSGAVLALEATKQLTSKVKKLALYEPPFIVDDSHTPLPKDYVPHLNQLIAAGRRGDAVEYFLTAAIGLPAEYIAPMRAAPMWAGMEAVAHTLAYDGTIMGDTMWGTPQPLQRWASVTAPTLVIVGGQSEPFFHTGTQTLAELLPNAQHRTLQGQDHNVDSTVLAPVLIEFFAG